MQVMHAESVEARQAEAGAARVLGQVSGAGQSRPLEGAPHLQRTGS